MSKLFKIYLLVLSSFSLYGFGCLAPKTGTKNDYFKNSKVKSDVSNPQATQTPSIKIDKNIKFINGKSKIELQINGKNYNQIKNNKSTSLAIIGAPNDVYKIEDNKLKEVLDTYSKFIENNSKSPLNKNDLDIFEQNKSYFIGPFANDINIETPPFPIIKSLKIDIFNEIQRSFLYSYIYAFGITKTSTQKDPYHLHTDDSSKSAKYLDLSNVLKQALNYTYIDQNDITIKPTITQFNINTQKARLAKVKKKLLSKKFAPSYKVIDIIIENLDKINYSDDIITGIFLINESILKSKYNNDTDQFASDINWDDYVKIKDIEVGKPKSKMKKKGNNKIFYIVKKPEELKKIIFKQHGNDFNKLFIELILKKRKNFNKKTTINLYSLADHTNIGYPKLMTGKTYSAFFCAYHKVQSEVDNQKPNLEIMTISNFKSAYSPKRYIGFKNYSFFFTELFMLLDYDKYNNDNYDESNLKWHKEQIDPKKYSLDKNKYPIKKLHANIEIKGQIETEKGGFAEKEECLFGFIILTDGIKAEIDETKKKLTKESIYEILKKIQNYFVGDVPKRELIFNSPYLAIYIHKKSIKISEAKDISNIIELDIEDINSFIFDKSKIFPFIFTNLQVKKKEKKRRWSEFHILDRLSFDAYIADEKKSIADIIESKLDNPDENLVQTNPLPPLCTHRISSKEFLESKIFVSEANSLIENVYFIPKNRHPFFTTTIKYGDTNLKLNPLYALDLFQMENIKNNNSEWGNYEDYFYGNYDNNGYFSGFDSTRNPDNKNVSHNRLPDAFFNQNKNSLSHKDKKKNTEIYYNQNYPRLSYIQHGLVVGSFKIKSKNDLKTVNSLISITKKDKKSRFDIIYDVADTSIHHPIYNHKMKKQDNKFPSYKGIKTTIKYREQKQEDEEIKDEFSDAFIGASFSEKNKKKEKLVQLVIVKFNKPINIKKFQMGYPQKISKTRTLKVYTQDEESENPNILFEIHQGINLFTIISNDDKDTDPQCLDKNTGDKLFINIENFIGKIHNKNLTLNIDDIDKNTTIKDFFGFISQHFTNPNNDSDISYIYEKGYYEKLEKIKYFFKDGANKIEFLCAPKDIKIMGAANENDFTNLTDYTISKDDLEENKNNIQTKINFYKVNTLDEDILNKLKNKQIFDKTIFKYFEDAGLTPIKEFLKINYEEIGT